MQTRDRDLMTFPKETRQIIYQIENYLSCYDFNACSNIRIAVQRGKVKVLSHKQFYCTKYDHQQVSLLARIDSLIWFIISMIFTFGISIAFYALCDPYMGCINLTIESEDEDLIRHLRLYFGDRLMYRMMNASRKVKVRITYNIIAID